MTIHGLDHINIAAPRDTIERCRTFYVDVVGLTDGRRPPFTSEGFWLYAGAQPIVHLSVKPSLSPGGGSLNHFALRCEGIDEIVARLNAHSIPFSSTTVPATGERQIFIDDPAGVGVELNFGLGPSVP